jgi:pimeloyl-ACP methyl ester carboxylesterase
MRSSLLRFVLTLLAAILPLGWPNTAASAEPGAPTRFTVTVKGQGPDLLLIPGLACSASVWDATVEQLRATRRVHVLQVAGFAGAPVAGNANGPVVEPLVEEIAAYIAAQKLESPAIIGHSLGGFAAMALAARHPASVGRVMAVDSLPFFPVAMNAGATAETARPAAEFMKAQLAHTPQAMFAATQATILQRMIKDDASRAVVAAEAGKSNPKVVAQGMYDLMTTDLRPELVKIQVPLTVLYAFDEALGLPQASVDGLTQTSYANAKAARLIRIDASRHFIMIDQPEKFAAAVDEFLK